MSLSNTTLLARLLSTVERSIDLQDAESDLSFQGGYSFANGTGADEADLLWTDERTINASSNDDLDLAGTFEDALGQAVVFARVKAILVIADEDNVNDVVIGNAAANQFVGPFGAAAHTHEVQPDGLYFAVAPGATAWPVTAGSADTFRIANGGAGTSVTYRIAILGASA